jgi:uncharacterized protein YbjT (DUF2867 family)
MDDLLNASYGIPDGEFRIAFHPQTPVGLIASHDIGAFAAHAFEHPAEWLGQTVEIAGDIKTPPQIAASLSHALGRTIAYAQTPLEIIEQQMPQVARAFEFLNEAGYQADLALLRTRHPELMTLDAYLATVALNNQTA